MRNRPAPSSQPSISGAEVTASPSWGAESDDIAPVALRTDEALDRDLLVGYDPFTSRAWAGAAPAAWIGPDAQIDLFPTAETIIDSALATGGDVFRRTGFTVVRIEGEGAATTLDAFVERHHHSLRGRGMNGTAFGLVAPDGELVGIANCARSTNTATAAGMQVRVREDRDLTPTARAHLTISEEEYCDAVRFCLAPEAACGASLGTGAESFFYAACLRYFVARNRAVWRAIRFVERGIPLPVWAQGLIDERVPFMKVVRSFADPADGHRGTIYAAAGAWYLGMTAARPTWVGRRSGYGLPGRARAKLRSDQAGHAHQVARAVWEGSSGQLTALDPVTGAVLGVRELAAIREAVPDGLPTAAHRGALVAALRAEQAALAETLGREARRLGWRSDADMGGYIESPPRPKLRFGTFLGRPFYAYALARRCRYIRSDILAAEAAWFAECHRWGRSIGYNWPQRPPTLGRRSGLSPRGGRPPH